jgi:hypothetical protein
MKVSAADKGTKGQVRALFNKGSPKRMLKKLSKKYVGKATCNTDQLQEK